MKSRTSVVEGETKIMPGMTKTSIAEVALRLRRRADDTDAKLLLNAYDRLVSAGRIVLDGLNTRIDEAEDDTVPIFEGIAELHEALALTESTSPKDKRRRRARAL